MLQIEGVIFASDKVNIVALPDRWVEDNTKAKLVGWNSILESFDTLSQMKVNVESGSRCLNSYGNKCFRAEYQICAIPLNGGDRIMSVINLINSKTMKKFLLKEYPHSTVPSLKFYKRSRGMFERFHRNVQGTFLELRKCPGFLNVPKQCSLNVPVERSRNAQKEY